MALSASKAILKQTKTALLLCDLQQKFVKHIYEFDKIITNSSKLVCAIIIGLWTSFLTDLCVYLCKVWLI